jgi:uncharacterized protein YndB with AHSA1/START domain
MRESTMMEHSIEIRAPLESVFWFVADPRKDTEWCPRVDWCRQRRGDGPGLGARYEARHRPTFQHPHSRWIEIREFSPPRHIASTQDDDIATFFIDYVLEPAAGATWLMQRDEIAWKIPRLHLPIAKRIVRRHMGDQLRTLKRLLEAEARADAAAIERAV